MGQRSDFSKPCQGAAEKSANATRCCCLARGRISTISANKKHQLRLVLFCISNRISPSFKKYVSIIFAQDLLKRIRKLDIRLLRPLWAPLGVLSGTEELFVFITPQHESFHVVGGVFQTVLVQHPGALGKAHTRQPVVLCYDHIPRFDPVDRRYPCRIPSSVHPHVRSGARCRTG